MDVIVLSEEEGVEKPSPLLWKRACERIGMPMSSEVLHIGDELVACVLFTPAIALAYPRNTP